MYNRYIPQPDGSYRKNPMQEPRGEPERHPPQSPPPANHNCPQGSSGCSACTNRPPQKLPPPPRPKPPSHGTGVISFLKQLIPKDFDAEDLLIVLLLLLMTGDCREEQNSALLTLVLYLFL